MPETKLFAFPQYENYSTMPNIFDRILGQSRAHNAIYTDFKALSVHFCFIGKKRRHFESKEKKNEDEEMILLKMKQQEIN